MAGRDLDPGYEWPPWLAEPPASPTAAQCASCRSDKWTTDEMSEHPSLTTYKSPDGWYDGPALVCPNCVRDNVACGAGCDEWLHPDDMLQHSTGVLVCEDCEGMEPCPGCGAWWFSEDMLSAETCRTCNTR